MTDREQEMNELDELRRKEFEESYYNSNHIFSQGRYELLWASSGEERFLQYAQNAEIKRGDLLKPSVRWVDGKIGGTVECVDITILEEGKKLSDIFYTTPYGVVKKNVTGIGATTLELRCERNSIIVVPTKALAYEKYKTGIDSETGVSRFLYVGSDMESVKAPSDDDISAYINSSIPFKKILVVADSLYKVLRHITIAEWFLMVDEIDIYQSDSVFRPSLENVIDYYFEFPATQRCLVSATIRPFSHPKIQEEPVININYSIQRKRAVTLTYSKNLNGSVTKHITKLLTEHPEEKIVVAYNKLQQIRQIIGLLSPDLQQRCAILCSPQSKERAGDFYTELEDGHLSKQITFITCTFFVGIDIADRFHLISVSNTAYLYTMLSPNRLQQIAGRCRPGLLSEQIYYNVRSDFEEINVDEKIGHLMAYADDMCNLANQAGVVMARHGNMVTDVAIRNLKGHIVKDSATAYCDSDPVSYIRLNKDGVCEISYFNIDAIREGLTLRTEMYRSVSHVQQALLTSCEASIGQAELEEKNDEQRQIENAVNEELDAIQKQAVSALVGRLRELAVNGSVNPMILTQLKRQASREEKRFLERFEKLQMYVPFENLVTTLQQENHRIDTWFKGYKNGVIFWALEEEHPFKIGIKQEFAINQGYSQNEWLPKIQELVRYHLSRTIPSDVTAIRFLQQLCSFTRENDRTKYRLVSYQNRQIAGDIEPLNRIGRNEPLQDLLEF